jgi:hypothetical protein
VKADVSADEARRQREESVRRLRDESARRIARDARWRSFTCGCALASLVGGISLAALNAHDVRSAEQEERRVVVALDAQIADAEATRSRCLDTIEQTIHEQFARAKTAEERDLLIAEGLARRKAVIDGAADEGCAHPVMRRAVIRSVYSRVRPDEVAPSVLDPALWE